MLLKDVIGYPEGSNLTIMNVFYTRPIRNEETGKYDKDYLVIIFKNNDTGKKEIRIDIEPEYTWYLLKKEYQTEHNLAFIEKDKVEPITCKYKDIKLSIAKETGNEDLYKQNMYSGNFRLNDAFFAHPRSFAADMNILNYTRSRFAEIYKNPVIPIDIFFFDIESDIIDSISDNVTIGECPVNAITGYYSKTNTLYNFVLRNKRNKQIQELEDDMKKDFNKYKEKVRSFIEYDLGSKEKVSKYKLDNVELSVGFFDDELSLILEFFKLVHSLSPDIVTAYNISYDLPSLIERLKANGADPRDVICDQDIPPQYRFCEYILDEKNLNNLEERGDFANISARSTYLDQMITYASRRKGQSAIESNKLDYVGTLECGVRKLDYHEITTDIGKLPYLNFYIFWLYNIIDVVVQVCIEAQTDDLKYVFNNVIEMNTPFQKIFRQTNYLGTKAVEFYKHHEGVIIGNNINRFGKKPEEKFSGAFVADPTKISDKNKVRINGQPIYKYNNGNDFDYKRLYPSLMQEFNMATNTQVGKIFIDNPPYKDPEYLKLSPGGTFTENLASYNYIEFCHRWLGMMDVEEILQEIPKMNLSSDKKQVIDLINPNKIVSIDVPMPNWVKDEVDKIRKDLL